MYLIHLLLVSHMMGDYVLQIDFLAHTKGQNWWHLFAHCITYTLPFAVLIGFDWRIIVLLITHFVIDTAKARFNLISYLQDQILHLIVLVIYFMR